MTKPSVPTVVWIANRGDPVDGKGSKLSVLKDGKLHLTDSAGSVVWKTKTEALTISEASNLQLRLMNTSNLVLYNFSSVAQSFDSSTDILLPQQLLTFGTSLISNRGQGLYSSGYYKFFFNEDNALHLLFQGPKLSSLYWPDPSLEDISDAGICFYNTSRAALLDDTGYFWSSDHFKFHATDFGTVTQRRLKLDADGNLPLYSLQEKDGSWDWIVTWQAISDPCRIHGVCGPNGVCTYDHVSGRRCFCLQGFKMKDHSDWSSGCEPEFNISCDHGDKTTFVQLAHVEYYGSDIDFLQNLTFQDCQEECLNRCNCKGFQYRFSMEDGGYNCYPKSRLLNGRRSPNFDGDLYLRVPKASISNHKVLDEEFRLQCSSIVSKQERSTYENKTVKLLL
ncbi:putative receptor protein kinase ZmPK1 [Quercus lobata]|uniref:putative receptor protein kinase ZmPK1 n=1 Tax=Quercus lobata TaxID=97700 RepID=UPI001248276A|nr:putative receptor protein kinase ZmPK1 [Quercus lobata]